VKKRVEVCQKFFSSSLVMLAIDSFHVILIFVVEMPGVFSWVFPLLSLPLNILGIVGVILHSKIKKGEVL